jgi:hypothetical protein
MTEQSAPSMRVKFDTDLLDALENCPRYALKTLGVEPTEEILGMIRELDFDQLRSLAQAFEGASPGKPSVESFP